MPAQRLPWFKFWPEAMEHEKVALLSDGEFRTWLALLAYGSKQPTRWRFASAKHAAVVCGRPIEHVEGLIAARLLDAAESDLWIHDWKQWQDVYPSDFSVNGAQSPGEKRRKTPRTLRDDSAKKEKREREVRPETKTESNAPTERDEACAPLDGRVSRFDETLTLVRGYQSRPELLQKIQDKYATLDLEEEALKIAEWMRRHPSRLANAAFILNWLSKALQDAAATPPPAPARTNGSFSHGTAALPRLSEADKYARGVKHV